MIQAGYDYSCKLERWHYPELNPEKKLVKKTYTRTDNRKKVLIKSVVLLFIYALVLVYLCITISTLGYQIVHLENDIHQLEKANARLQCEIQETCSLERIEQVAIKDLGMHEADKRIAVAAVDEKIVAEPVKRSNKNTGTQVGEKPLQKLYCSLKVMAGNSF